MCSVPRWHTTLGDKSETDFRLSEDTRMNKNGQKQQRNDFRVRLYDAETVKSIDELLKTGDFSSVNELLGKAIAIGIEKIYVGYGKRKRLELATMPTPEVPDVVKLENIKRELDNLRVLDEDMYILMNSIKGLTASVYNVLRANVKGEPLSVELLDDYGYMATMPDSYLEIENNLQARFNRMGKKGEKK